MKPYFRVKATVQKTVDTKDEARELSNKLVAAIRTVVPDYWAEFTYWEEVTEEPE